MSIRIRHALLQDVDAAADEIDADAAAHDDENGVVTQDADVDDADADADVRAGPLRS